MKLTPTISLAASILFVSACSGPVSQTNEAGSNNSNQTSSRPDIYGNFSNNSRGVPAPSQTTANSGNSSSAMNTNTRPSDPSSGGDLADKTASMDDKSSRGPLATPTVGDRSSRGYASSNASSRSSRTVTPDQPSALSSSRSSEANVPRPKSGQTNVSSRAMETNVPYRPQKLTNSNVNKSP
jgi:hypothetical protein